MKRLCKLLCAVGLAVAAILLLVNWRIGPERTVERMLEHLSSGRFARAASYTVDGSLRLEDQSWSARRFYKRVYRSLQYTVVDSEVDGDTAKVTVVISMIDLDALLAETAVSSLDTSLFGQLSASSYRRQLTKRIKSGKVEYVMETVRVYLVRESGRWKVDMDDSSSFAKAITGGYTELIGY